MDRNGAVGGRPVIVVHATLKAEEDERWRFEVPPG
jgi:hypothetical protein